MGNHCFCSVFRHHTNPVGTEWRWQMDDAETILNGAIQNHTNLIKQFRGGYLMLPEAQSYGLMTSLISTGVPGVQADRFAEGMSPRHCALSLVGEPIMYPEINKFIELLHSKSISSFLVTNAQFPDAIRYGHFSHGLVTHGASFSKLPDLCHCRNLLPVTQLYVSVDASTKDSLKKIDRPLFRDFWERLLDSLKALSEKGQRTVYRLTLVKSWNTDEIQNYAELVKLGQPDFIEIKVGGIHGVFTDQWNLI